MDGTATLGEVRSVAKMCICFYLLYLEITLYSMLKSLEILLIVVVVVIVISRATKYGTLN